MATDTQTTKPGRPVVSPTRSPADDEAALLKQMEEEEEAKKAAKEAADMVERAQAASAHHAASPKSPAIATPVKHAGDIPVTCLQNESICTMGSRRYVLKKGAEIMMDPNHAEELSQGPNPWVVPIRVVTSHR
jgi:hypothetical protein